MSVLSLSNIGHAYLGRTVLDAIDLIVGKGEMMALVGPSGCGKWRPALLSHVPGVSSAAISAMPWCFRSRG
jgi:NitT/TauT family transport system ATP-binding protein